jgi:hypothetical protein
MKSMRQLLTALLAVLTVLTVPSGLKAKSGGTTNVTTIVYDTDATGGRPCYKVTITTAPDRLAIAASLLRAASSSCSFRTNQ